jgi:hypothetical protein
MEGGVRGRKSYIHSLSVLEILFSDLESCFIMLCFAFLYFSFALTVLSFTGVGGYRSWFSSRQAWLDEIWQGRRVSKESIRSGGVGTDGRGCFVFVLGF